jgi:uncharacterized protein (DUF1330 family)
MAKAYWIAHVTVTDPDAYARYVAANAAAFAKHGGRFLARGGRSEIVEGNGQGRNVIIEFDSFEQAKACWDSPEYQRAKAFRAGGATGDFIIVEGVGA